jgi:hypothetical protein
MDEATQALFSLCALARRFCPSPGVQLSVAKPETRDLKGNLMATWQLKNDKVDTFTILVLDPAGGVVPAPSGDVFAVTSSDSTKLNAVIGQDSKGNPAVVINALIQQSTPGSLSYTLSDSAGLTKFVEQVDIVQDVTPTALGVDLTNVEETSQPVPSATGP